MKEQREMNTNEQQQTNEQAIELTNNKQVKYKKNMEKQQHHYYDKNMGVIATYRDNIVSERPNITLKDFFSDY